MSDRSIQRKEDYLDWMCEKFCASSRAYVSVVKEALRYHTKENAVDLFESAVDVLSQDFPDPTPIDGKTQERDGGDGNELNSLKDRIAQMEKQLQEAQNKHFFLESQLKFSIKKNVRRLDTKLECLATETKDSIKELTEVSNENSANIKGMRKLQVLLKERTQAAAAATTAAAAATPPPTAPTASALSRPLKDVRQRTNFTAKVATDKLTPEIQDVKLVAGGRLVLADWANKCIKLFDTQGQHLHTLVCRSYPSRLAVIDSSGLSNCHTFAVTLPVSHGIDIIEAGGDKMKVMRTIQTTKQYFTVVALSKHTLAAGYLHGAGIDLLDSDGRVLRQICSSVRAWFMDVTEDGELVCSTWDKKIVRVQVDSGTVVFDASVPQIKDPRGITIASDGSILVADGSSRTLHMLSSQGVWTKLLWSVPGDRDQDDQLFGVSKEGSVCGCITQNGSVYILDCLH
ncbi:tripartite motif-containing protein 45 [Plakobranchus ocellatus]|uniref:Tripartite motif-containing protein 45 n=1 Tax=Plakobranchus ocellatus TaxID=259542 RepID=A0AAV4A4H2_9GAST|nr:tripartite motif-containing protein 45 [Plakobranchus ocellatus]